MTEFQKGYIWGCIMTLAGFMVGVIFRFFCLVLFLFFSSNVLSASYGPDPFKNLLVIQKEPNAKHKHKTKKPKKRSDNERLPFRREPSPGQA